MRYYRTYNIIAISFMVVLACFLGWVIFGQDTYDTDVISVEARPLDVNVAKPIQNKDSQMLQADETLKDANLDEMVFDSQGDGKAENFSDAVSVDAGSNDSFSKTDGAVSTASAAAGSSVGGSAAGSGGGGSAGNSSTGGDGKESTDSPSPPATSQNAASSLGGGAGLPQSLNVHVLSSLTRVLQDEAPLDSKSNAEVFCAKNETESFQLLVYNPSTVVLPDIEIMVSPWQPLSSSNRTPELTLYREHYVKVEKSSYILKSKLGMYPDALIPFVDPYTNKPIASAKYLANHQSVLPRKSQGYWADVKVGSDVPAGDYTCSILVTSSDNPIAEISVKLHVWDFALPPKRAWTAWFYGFYNIDKVYGTTGPGTAQYEQLWERHQKMTFDHGIYPVLQKHPQINTDTGDVNFYDGQYIPALKAFVEKYGSGILYIPLYFEQASDAAKLKKYLSAYHAFSAANPWAGQYVYNIDEQQPEEYSNVTRLKGILSTYAPSVKLMVCGNIYPSNVMDATDIFVLLFDSAKANTVKKLLDKNISVWAYTALVQRSESCPNWQLDAEIIEYRIPAWASYSTGITGILYWRTILGTTETDPWIDPVSHIISNGLIYNGEGLLMYPGTKAGFAGPVASMRMKVFRDSVEDYAYFKLLESKIGKAQAVSKVSAIASDFRTYDENPESYIAQRKAIAELILK